nr:MAG TPA: hypothetical protein [Caudoviricetes sp.]
MKFIYLVVDCQFKHIFNLHKFRSDAGAQSGPGLAGVLKYVVGHGLLLSGNGDLAVLAAAVDTESEGYLREVLSAGADLQLGQIALKILSFVLAVGRACLCQVNLPDFNDLIVVQRALQLANHRIADRENRSRSDLHFRHARGADRTVLCGGGVRVLALGSAILCRKRDERAVIGCGVLQNAVQIDDLLALHRLREQLQIELVFHKFLPPGELELHLQQPVQKRSFCRCVCQNSLDYPPRGPREGVRIAQLPAEPFQTTQHFRNRSALSRTVVPNVNSLVYAADYSVFCLSVCLTAVCQIDKGVWRVLRRQRPVVYVVPLLPRRDQQRCKKFLLGVHPSTSFHQFLHILFKLFLLLFPGWLDKRLRFHFSSAKFHIISVVRCGAYLSGQAAVCKRCVNGACGVPRGVSLHERRFCIFFHARVHLIPIFLDHPLYSVQADPFAQALFQLHKALELNIIMCHHGTSDNTKDSLTRNLRRLSTR